MECQLVPRYKVNYHETVQYLHFYLLQWEHPHTSLCHIFVCRECSCKKANLTLDNTQPTLLYLKVLYNFWKTGVGTMFVRYTSWSARRCSTFEMLGYIFFWSRCILDMRIYIIYLGGIKLYLLRYTLISIAHVKKKIITTWSERYQIIIGKSLQQAK